MKHAFTLLVVVSLLFATSCASLSKKINPNEAQTADSAYLVFKAVSTSQSLLGDPIELALGDPGEPLGARTYIHQFDKPKFPYTIVKVAPGSYRVWSVKSTNRNFLTKVTTVTTYEMPVELRTIAKVNPGEILYIGDFIWGEKSRGDNRDTLHVALNFEDAKETVSKAYPTFGGYTWLPLTVDRPSF